MYFKQKAVDRHILTTTSELIHTRRYISGIDNPCGGESYNYKRTNMTTEIWI